MEVQMRQAYANIQKVLAQYGATIYNIVDELLFVTDMDAAFAARVKCRQKVFPDNPVLVSTILQIQRIPFPELMVEIRCICKLQDLLYLYSLFRSCEGRIPVICGFGGMGDKFDPIIPPTGNKVIAKTFLEDSKDIIINHEKPYKQ